jgi:ankyrin repeat protein
MTIRGKQPYTFCPKREKWKSLKPFSTMKGWRITWFSALLVQDKLGWTPFMSATKADTGAREIMEKFLQFLIQHMTNNDPSDCLNKLIETKNKSTQTQFTLLMRNGHEDFGKSREKLFELMEKHSNPQGMAKWFNILVRQLAEPNSCDLTARSMKELILLASRTDVDLKTVMTERIDRYGNTMLMELAKNMKDEALREILTSSITSNHVSFLLKCAQFVKLCIS